MQIKKTRLLAVSMIAASAFETSLLYAHGALSFPPSRQFLCSSLSGSIMCKDNSINPNIGYNWQSLGIGSAAGYEDRKDYKENPLAGHIAAMGGKLDAKICSANGVVNSWYNDLSNPSKLSAWHSNRAQLHTGINEFVYYATAPHMTGYSPAGHTGYIDIYLTKDGWDQSKPLTYNDVDSKPICHYVPDAGGIVGSNHRFNCDIPASYAGKDAVVFAVWQRSDSAEAFYSCSDVSFNGESVVHGWSKLKSDRGPSFLPKFPKLTINETIIFSVSNDHGISKTYLKVDNQESVNHWQNLLAKKFNAQNQDIQIGVLSNDESIEVPHDSAGYRVYIKENLVNSGYSWNIKHQKISVPSIPESEHWLVAKNVSVESAITKQRYTVKLNDKVKFRLFEGNVEHIVEFTITKDNLSSWVSELAMSLSDKVGDVAAIGQLSQAGESVIANEDLSFVYINAQKQESTGYQYTWVLDITPVIPEPNVTYVYMYDDGYDQKYFTVGVDVISRVKDEASGLYKVYQCKDKTVEGWCQQSESSSYHYEPGKGAAWQNAWIETGRLAERPVADTNYPEWSEGLGGYQMGSIVARAGKLYECTGHQDWCNQNAYDPIGHHGYGTWTEIEQ